MAGHDRRVVLGRAVRGANWHPPAAVDGTGRRARAAEQVDGDEEAAARLLDETDRDREGYVRYFYKVDPRDSRLYHLLLDSTVIPLDVCSDLIVTAARSSSRLDLRAGRLRADRQRRRAGRYAPGIAFRWGGRAEGECSSVRPNRVRLFLAAEVAALLLLGAGVAPVPAARRRPVEPSAGVGRARRLVHLRAADTRPDRRPAGLLSLRSQLPASGRRPPSASRSRTRVAAGPRVANMTGAAVNRCRNQSAPAAGGGGR